jgi:hypothetical protein
MKSTLGVLDFQLSMKFNLSNTIFSIIKHITNFGNFFDLHIRRQNLLRFEHYKCEPTLQAQTCHRSAHYKFHCDAIHSEEHVSIVPGTPPSSTATTFPAPASPTAFTCDTSNSHAIPHRTTVAQTRAAPSTCPSHRPHLRVPYPKQ